MLGFELKSDMLKVLCDRGISVVSVLEVLKGPQLPAVQRDEPLIYWSELAYWPTAL